MSSIPPKFPLKPTTFYPSGVVKQQGNPNSNIGIAHLWSVNATNYTKPFGDIFFPGFTEDIKELIYEKYGKENVTFTEQAFVNGVLITLTIEVIDKENVENPQQSLNNEAVKKYVIKELVVFWEGKELKEMNYLDYKVLKKIRYGGTIQAEDDKECTYLLKNKGQEETISFKYDKELKNSRKIIVQDTGYVAIFEFDTIRNNFVIITEDTLNEVRKVHQFDSIIFNFKVNTGFPATVKVTLFKLSTQTTVAEVSLPLVTDFSTVKKVAKIQHTTPLGNNHEL